MSERDELDELMLTAPAELRCMEILREAHAGLVERFGRAPQEARVIVAAYFGATPGEVERAIGDV